MPFLTPPSSADRIPTAGKYGVFFLCALWLLAGTLGHDPWKPEDVLHLDVAWNMTKGDWLIPRIAGEPWLTSPPLYHWLAALCGQLFGWMLPWHDAARLASTLLGAAFLATLAANTRLLAGASAALAAPLLAIGTLGFLMPFHDAQPAIAATAGFSLSILGLLQWRHSPVRGGLLFGAGVGIGFLGTGLEGMTASLITGLLVLWFPAWRTRGSFIAILAATGIALALILPWPLLLKQKAPALFDLWWRSEQDSIVPRSSFTRAHFELLLWASWPVLPLALWQLWLERHRLLLTETFLPLAAACAALLIFFIGDPKPVALLPVLASLVLLAAAGARRLRRGAANAFDWFGMMTFSLLAALIWLGGIAMLTGEPARVAKNFSKPAPGFIAEVSAITIILALVATVGWVVVMLRTPRSPWRATARWSVGLTVVWVLLATLWLPWIDYGKSYRSTSADFRQMLDGQKSCIARRNLGLAQRASLDYFDAIRTVNGAAAKECHYLIVQATPRTEKPIPGWKLVLQTSRPGDKTERLRLYHRD